MDGNGTVSPETSHITSRLTLGAAATAEKAIAMVKRDAANIVAEAYVSRWKASWDVLVRLNCNEKALIYARLVHTYLFLLRSRLSVMQATVNLGKNPRTVETMSGALS